MLATVMTGAAIAGADVTLTVDADNAFCLRARAKLKPVIVAPMVRNKHTVWQTKPPPRLAAVTPPKSLYSLARVAATSDRAIR